MEPGLSNVIVERRDRKLEAKESLFGDRRFRLVPTQRFLNLPILFFMVSGKPHYSSLDNLNR